MIHINKRNGFAMLFVIFWMIGSNVMLAQSNGQRIKPNNLFKVVATLPSWSLSDDALPFNKLTHIQYASIRPTVKGELTALENPQKLTDIVAKAHDQEVLVGITVGGWSNLKNEDFQEMASQQVTRKNFISNVVALVEKFQLDGVDVNWQYPSSDADQTNYAVLLDELSLALHAKGKYLSATVPASGEHGDKIQVPALNAVDFLNVQAYDAGEGGEHSTFKFASSGVSYWVNRGVPSSKIVLGIPFHAQPTWKSYRTLVSEGANANIDTYEGNLYNGLYTVKQKMHLALDRNLGGVMISDITQDAMGENSLVRAIHQSIPKKVYNLAISVPFEGIPHTIPGVIEAEQYDLGAEGVAYHDLKPENSGGAFRSDAVDIEVNPSGKGDYKIANIQAGEWLMYSVNVKTSGPLKLEVEVASVYGDKTFHIEMDGVDISGKIVVPNTGGWGEWKTVTVTTSNLKPGKKMMRVVMDDGDFNLNRITYLPRITTEPTDIVIESETKEETIAHLSMHPNPGVSGAPQNVTLTFDSPDLTNVRVMVTDISGNVMHKSIYAVDASKTVTMSLPQLRSGVYVVRVQSDNQTWTKRYFAK